MDEKKAQKGLKCKENNKNGSINPKFIEGVIFEFIKTVI